MQIVIVKYEQIIIHISTLLTQCILRSKKHFFFLMLFVHLQAHFVNSE